jgi:hypothetical protein
MSYNTRCKKLGGLALSNLKNLRELILTNNELTTMAGLLTLPSLQSLNVSNNRISKIQGLELVPNLKVFIARNNAIQSMLSLRCLSMNIELECLDLRGNPVCSSGKYASLRNFISPGVALLDGKKIKSHKSSSPHEHQGSDPNSHAVADSDYEVNNLSMSRQFGSELESADQVPLPGQQSFTNGTSSTLKTGYTAQYLNSTRGAQKGNDSLVSGMFFSPIQESRTSNPRSPIIFQRERYSDGSVEDQSVSGSVVLNGNGNPRLKSFRNAQAKIDRSKSVRNINSRFEDMYIDDISNKRNCRKGDANSRTSGTAREVYIHSRSRANQDQSSKTGGASDALIAKNEIISGDKPSSLPWRRAPTIKPRPWKGLHWNEAGEDEDKWEPKTSGNEGKFQNANPWIGGNTIDAFEKATENISTKNPLKQQVLKSREPAANIFQFVEPSQREKDDLHHKGSSPYRSKLKHSTDIFTTPQFNMQSNLNVTNSSGPHLVSSNGQVYGDAMWISNGSGILGVSSPNRNLSRSTDKESSIYRQKEKEEELQLSDLAERDFGEGSTTSKASPLARSSSYSYIENYRNINVVGAQHDDVETKFTDDLDLSQLTTGSDMNADPISNTSRVRAYYADYNEDLREIVSDDDTGAANAPHFAQDTFSRVMRKSPVRTTDPRLSEVPQQHQNKSGTNRHQHNEHTKNDINLTSPPRLQSHHMTYTTNNDNENSEMFEYSREDVSSESSSLADSNSNLFFAHTIAEPDESVVSSSVDKPSTEQRSAAMYTNKIVKTERVSDTKGAEDTNRVSVLLEDLGKQKEAAFQQLQLRLEKFTKKI